MRGKSLAVVTAASLMAAFAADAGVSYYEPGLGFGSRGWQRRRGPGWSTRQVQRMARKRRNVLRNRRAHR